MPRLLKKAAAIELAWGAFPAYLQQRKKAELMSTWRRGEQDTLDHSLQGRFTDGRLYRPSGVEINDEYDDLASRSPTPWLGLTVSSLTQTLFIDGVSLSGEKKMLNSWRHWQRNRLDKWQSSLYRGVFDHGIAYGSALPGRDPLGGGLGVDMRFHGATKVAAFFADFADEWPMFAISCEPTVIDNEDGWTVNLMDEVGIYYLFCKGDGTDPKTWGYISDNVHTSSVCPIVPYTNIVDLDGKTYGEVEPLIPLARRIDQDTFDRLIVQRFGAWKIRYVAGMARPKDATAAQDRLAEMRLRVKDILVSTESSTKFGTLDETQLDGFISARDADLRDLSAVAQVAPWHMLGLNSNLAPEALKEAKSGMSGKQAQAKVTLGESHEQFMRLAAHIVGDTAEQQAYNLQVRWRNTDEASLSQSADALAKFAQQVGMPQEMVFEMVPGWTDSDVERAMKLVNDGTIDTLFAELEAQGLVTPPAAA